MFTFAYTALPKFHPSNTSEHIFRWSDVRCFLKLIKLFPQLFTSHYILNKIYIRGTYYYFIKYNDIWDTYNILYEGIV